MKNKGRLVVLILGVILMLRVGMNVVKLYKAGDRVVEAKKQLEAKLKENNDLKQRLAQVQTPEYMEKEARDKLGMGKDGEVVVIIPEDELKAEARTKDVQPENEANWVEWRKLYLGF